MWANKKERSVYSRFSKGWLLWFIISAFGLLVLMSGCGGKIDDDTAALVNGRKIRMRDLTQAVKMGLDVGASDVDSIGLKNSVLDQLIAEELIVQEAEALGLSITDQELEQQIKILRADFPDQAFEEMLIREYVDYNVWKERLRRSLLIQHTTEAAIKTRTRNDPEDWRAFYRQYISRLEDDRSVQVMHVTVQKKANIEAAQQKLASGESFEQVAVESGISKDSEGLKPVWVQLKFLPEPMAGAIWATEVGKTSQIVESEFGYSIFKVLAVESSEGKTPLSLMSEIQKRYLDRKASQAYAEWMSELRVRANIVIHPSLKDASTKSD